MKIVLYLQDQKYEFLLPQQISGSFSFDANETEESKLIHVEARDGKWMLCSTSDVKIVNQNQTIDMLPLMPNQFYVLRRGNHNYFIYAREIVFPGFELYTFQKDVQITIGNAQNCSIQYAIPYIQGVFAKIYYRDQQLVLEKAGQGNIYINSLAM